MSQAKEKIPKRQSKIVTVELSPDDQDYIERIKKEFGLKATTDCMRLALRECIKRVDSLQPA